MAATETDQQAEIARLRARVEALEAELLAQTERTERIVAAAQERTYWLDRWHLDVNALMRRRGATALYGATRAVVRVLKRIKWALRPES